MISVILIFSFLTFHFSNSQRVADSSQQVDSIYLQTTFKAIALLKTKYFESKDVIELLEWDTILEEVMKGKVLDPKAEQV